MENISRNFLEVRSVSHTYVEDDMGDPVLDDVTFDLPQSDSLAVIGPSGCGKTTLILMIAGLIRPSRGDLFFKGQAITAPRRETGLVLQDYGLFPWKTVRKNIALGARIQKTPADPGTIMELEEELGIFGLGHLYPQQLSGGQRQRVALARALLLRPELLLLDEPFAALDALTRERLQQALLDLYRRRNLSYIIVTHNIEEAVMLGRRVLVFGGRPARIKALMDNPTFGSDDPRSSEDFFAASVSLRKMLEDNR